MSYINVTKNAQGQHYKYADLIAVAKQITDAGFDFRQRTRYDKDAEQWVVETRIKWPDEDKFEDWSSPVPIIAGAKLSNQGKRILSDMQEYQSALTSARRYSLYVCANIIPDDDDDRSAGGNVVAPPESPRVTTAQWSRYQAAVLSIHEDIKTYAESIIKRPLARPGDLSVDEYNQIMDSMGAKK